MTMVEKLFQKANPETHPSSQGKHYLRLIGDDHVPEAANAEDAPVRPHQRLTEKEIERWNCIVDRANQLVEQISLVHQMIGDDVSPSEYRPAYKTLWSQYEEAIASLWEIDSEAVVQFRDRVIARVKELEARMNDLLSDWDPSYSDFFERTIACYEKTHDLMVVLDKDWALLNAEKVAGRTKKHLATRGWCLWQCQALGGETIAVVRDVSVQGVPEGYPIYYEDELNKLFGVGVNHSTLRLVHEAKKIAGAIVTDVEDASRTVRHSPRMTEPVRRCRCGSTDFWLRSPSQWGTAEWLCSRCHPQPQAATNTELQVPSSLVNSKPRRTTK